MWATVVLYLQIHVSALPRSVDREGFRCRALLSTLPPSWDGIAALTK